MIFSIEALDAKNGDCLILHFGTPADPHFVLIDGGTRGVYTATLGPRLRQLRGLNPDQPLTLERVIISHIDDDHIKGIIDMTDELVEMQDDGLSLPVDVRGLWHNSFDDIVGNAPAAFPSAVRSLLVRSDSAAIVANVNQGRTLRNNAEELAWRVNRPFPSLVMLETGGPREVAFDGDMTLAVLAPSEARLNDLRDEWDKELPKLLAAEAGPGNIASILDNSVPNLSSIVVLASCDGKTMLLTGDAGGDDIRDGLAAAGLMSGGKIHVDVLKMPHHGSIRNVDEAFLTAVKADHYVFSANGRDDNPDTPTLELLTRVRGSDAYAMHFTNLDGKGGLRARMEQYFASDALNDRNYTVHFRNEESLSISIDLGTDSHP